MIVSLILVELTVLIWVAVEVIVKLAKSEDGNFKNLMIGYFLSEIIFLIVLVWLEVFYGERMISPTQIVILFGLLPKFFMKIIFYNFIR